MILIDPRSGSENQKDHTTIDQMVAYIRQIGVACEKGPLQYGDVAFEGNTSRGRSLIGVERKSLHDILNCIDDSRYSGFQKIGMGGMYAASFLVVEGLWKPHNPEGWLMEGYREGTSWGFCQYRAQKPIYAKLFRYLLSVSLSNVVVITSRDLWHTCYDICEIYKYFDKPWDSHTSMLEVPHIAVPDMRVRPPLVRKWAVDIEDVGVKLSMAAEEYFKTPIRLAQSSEMDWLKLPRVGIKTARKIIKEIQGWL